MEPRQAGGCCSHAGSEGWEGQQARGWSSGAGVTEGTLKTSGQPAAQNVSSVCSVQCGGRQPRAAVETLNAQLFPFNLFQPK